MIFANVVPLGKIPPDKNQSYTYQDKSGLVKCAGQLVKIPIRNKISFGVISSTNSISPANTSFAIKEVTEVLSEESFITLKQTKLFNWLGQYYWLGLSYIYKKIIPLPKKKVNIVKKEKNKYKGKYTKNLLLASNLTEKQNLFCAEIKKILSSNQQALVISPEKTSLSQISDFLKFKFGPEKIVEIHGNITENQLLKIWLRILSGESLIILGTRQAVFMPFTNLGLIIVDDEHNSSHKQWDSGFRYDARIVADKLAEIHKTKIIFSSPCPRISTFYQFQEKKYKVLLTKNINIKKILLANMKKELDIKNYSPISNILREELENTLRQKNQAILIVNQRGYSSFVLCRDCGFVPKCPHCSISLTEYSNKQIKCLSCGYQTNIMLVCPNCKSSRIKGFGIGTEKVFEEIKKILPQAKIGVYDRDSIKTIKSTEKLFQSFDTGAVDILIGTSVLATWKSERLKLIGFINIDSLLNSPNWDSREKAFALISQVSSLHPELLAIQSYNPDHPSIQESLAGDYEKFYIKELKERRTFNYPPFAKFIKLIIKDKDNQKARQQAYLSQKILLKNLSSTKNTEFQKSIKIYPPQATTPAKVRDKYSWQIIIRVSQSQDFTETNSHLFSNLNANCLIDHEPENIY